MCLGIEAVPFFLSLVFLQSDWDVPFVTTTSSPAGVQSSLGLSPSLGFRLRASTTPSGTFVVPLLLRVVVPRRSSSAKSERGRFKSPILNHTLSPGVTLGFKPLETRTSTRADFQHPSWRGPCQAQDSMRTRTPKVIRRPFLGISPTMVGSGSHMLGLRN